MRTWVLQDAIDVVDKLGRQPRMSGLTTISEPILTFGASINNATGAATYGCLICDDVRNAKLTGVNLTGLGGELADHFVKAHGIATYYGTVSVNGGEPGGAILWFDDVGKWQLSFDPPVTTR